MPRLSDPSVIYSLMLAILAFGLDRAHKHFHVAADCIGFGEARCIEVFAAYTPLTLTGWRGGEIVEVTSFFDYVLVWNTGISYGLFAGFPTWVVGLVMLGAMVVLAVWWVRTDSLVLRAGLGLCLGGALSNAVDRAIFGAVADFFHFHVAGWSFYIFNIADMAISLGVVLLIADIVLPARAARKPRTR